MAKKTKPRKKRKKHKLDAEAMQRIVEAGVRHGILKKKKPGGRKSRSGQLALQL